MNKNGSARDIILIAVLVFALGIAFLATNYMINTSITKILAVDVVNESSSSVAAFESLQGTLGRMDYIIMGFFVGFILFLLISGWIIGGHPVFMVIYFIFVIIATAVSAVLANAWDDFSQASVFGSTVTSFPFTNHILANLPIYIAVIGILGMVVMFAKPYITNEGEFN